MISIEAQGCTLVVLRAPILGQPPKQKSACSSSNKEIRFEFLYFKGAPRGSPHNNMMKETLLLSGINHAKFQIETKRDWQ